MIIIWLNNTFLWFHFQLCTLFKNFKITLFSLIHIISYEECGRKTFFFFKKCNLLNWRHTLVFFRLVFKILFSYKSIMLQKSLIFFMGYEVFFVFLLKIIFCWCFSFYSLLWSFMSYHFSFNCFFMTILVVLLFLRLKFFVHIMHVVCLLSPYTLKL